LYSLYILCLKVGVRESNTAARRAGGSFEGAESAEGAPSVKRPMTARAKPKSAETFFPALFRRGRVKKAKYER